MEQINQARNNELNFTEVLNKVLIMRKANLAKTDMIEHLST